MNEHKKQKLPEKSVAKDKHKSKEALYPIEGWNDAGGQNFSIGTDLPEVTPTMAPPPAAVKASDPNIPPPQPVDLPQPVD